MENETHVKDLEDRLSVLESQLKAALRSASSVDALGDPKPMGDPLTVEFKRKMTRYAIITWGFLVFSCIIAAGCYIVFESTLTTKYQLLWMTFFSIAIMQTVLMKLWYWIIWNRYSVVREVKRLELRIVELVEKLEKR
jgi:hypothetical protein